MPSVTEKRLVKKLRLRDLEFADYNPRTITESALAGLRDSLGELGMIDMPVVNAVDGRLRLIGGHQRVKVLLEEGFEYADCLIVMLDSDAEQAANLALNNPAIQGKWDLKAAIPNMDEILKGLPKPDHMQFDKLRQELRKRASLNPETASTFKKHDKPGKPKSKQGEVYTLGQHKLYCGDALKLPAAFFGKQRARACVTDPPYGVEYTVGEDGKVENDGLHPKLWETFLHDACEMLQLNTSGACYIFMSSKSLPAFQESWMVWGGVIRRWLVWAKDQPTMMAMRSVDFQNQYEWIMYGYGEGCEPPAPETPRINVLAHPKPASNKLHPTQKPLDLIRALIEDGTSEGEIVFDPFAGSGTTLVACEALKRVCFAVEIEPRYADTIRKRWAETVYGESCDWVALTRCKSRKAERKKRSHKT